MRRHLVVFVALSLAVVATNGSVAADKEDKDTILGTWVVVAFEREGKRMEIAEGGDMYFKLVITADKMKYQPAKGQEEEGTYKLDAGKKPKTLDITPTTGDQKGKTMLGLYELEGDKLRIAFSDFGDKVRPVDFKSAKEGVAELKRIK